MQVLEESAGGALAGPAKCTLHGPDCKAQSWQQPAQSWQQAHLHLLYVEPTVTAEGLTSWNTACWISALVYLGRAVPGQAFPPFMAATARWHGAVVGKHY